MENYIRPLRSYVAVNAPHFGDGDTDSILDMRFIHYNAFNSLDILPDQTGFDCLYAKLSKSF